MPKELMKKYIIWQKVVKNIYNELEYSDETMMTLSLFLNDGVGYRPFINFLDDPERNECFGNISELEKKGTLVKVNIDDYIYPGMPPFITSIANLKIIMKEVYVLEEAESSLIKLTLNDDVLEITGE